MSHHIAELIEAAETAPSKDERRKKEREVAETISTLWAHRSSYENRINPLFDLKPIIDVIRTLDPAHSPWMARSDVTGHVFDTFRRLIICLLLRRLGTIDRASKAANAAQRSSAFQNEEERELVATLNTWIALTRETAEAKPSRRKSESSSKEVDLDVIAKEIIAEAHRALDAVLTDLENGNDGRKERNNKVSTVVNIHEDD